MIAIWLIAGVVAVAVLLAWIDGLEFPDSLGIALDVIQLLALVVMIDRLNREDSTPGS